jgi:hypothetical protein
MICKYDANVASVVGVNAATIFDYIMYFVFDSKCRHENFFNGKYWTQETNDGLEKQFFFMSKKEITASIATLVFAQFLEITIGNNGSQWFSIGKNGEQFFIQNFA